MQLSTFSPHVIPMIFTILGVLSGIIAGACAYYVARELRALKTLRLDVGELFERLEALTARFTTFQKRENMRKVREEKTSQKDLQEEAAAILAQAQGGAGGSGQSRSGGVVSKTALYRRRH